MVETSGIPHFSTQTKLEACFMTIETPKTAFKTKNSNFEIQANKGPKTQFPHTQEKKCKKKEVWCSKSNDPIIFSRYFLILLFLSPSLSLFVKNTQEEKKNILKMFPFISYHKRRSHCRSSHIKSHCNLAFGATSTTTTTTTT